jgi:hypothetical protein
MFFSSSNKIFFKKIEREERKGKEKNESHERTHWNSARMMTTKIVDRVQSPESSVHGCFKEKEVKTETSCCLSLSQHAHSLTQKT